MRQLGRNLARFLGRHIWDLPGEEEVTADSFQRIVLDSDATCFTVSGAVLNADGLSYDTVNDIASAGYVVPLGILDTDGNTHTVTTTVRDTDANNHTVAGTTTMYVFGGVPITTKGTAYTTVSHTVRDSDGNIFNVANAVLDSDGNSFDVVGKILNSNTAQFTTACGERIVVQDSDTFYHTTRVIVRDTDGNLHTVTSAVLDSDGNSFTVN